MNRIFYLAVLLVLIGIQPALAIEFDFDAMNQQSAETEATEAPTTTVDLGQASDEEVAEALEEKPTDVELVNETQAVETDPATEQPALTESAPAEPAAEQELAEEAPAETPAIAEEETPAEEEPAVAEETPAAAPEFPSIAEEDIPYSIRNNQYFRESQRLAKLAEDTYDYGDYDASTTSAEEAIYYAMLSDVYVAMALAKARLDWAVASGASKEHPVEFQEAETWYKESVSARDAEEWVNAIEAAYKVIDILAYINAPAGTFPLPAKYTVRSWLTVRDCFWNIAGRPWVYGNPHLWRVLYNANRAKLPNPDNPNLIEPGMVLDIPSIKGENRQGEWSSNRTYGALP